MHCAPEGADPTGLAPQRLRHQASFARPPAYLEALLQEEQRELVVRFRGEPEAEVSVGLHRAELLLEAGQPGHHEV